MAFRESHKKNLQVRIPPELEKIVHDLVHADPPEGEPRNTRSAITSALLCRALEIDPARYELRPVDLSTVERPGAKPRPRKSSRRAASA